MFVFIFMIYKFGFLWPSITGQVIMRTCANVLQRIINASNINNYCVLPKEKKKSKTFNSNLLLPKPFETENKHLYCGFR